MHAPTEPARCREVDLTVDRVVRRARAAVFFGRLFRWSAIGFLAAGSVALLVRANWFREVAAWPFLLAPLALAAGVAGVATARRALSRSAAAAWIDVASGGSGWVVTGGEAPDARWNERIARALESLRALPAPRLFQPFVRASAAGGFLAAALWIEIPERQPGPSPELAEALLASLADKLETLNENVDLNEDLADELAKRLGQLEEELADEVSPESLFEAMDSLEERLQAEAERSGVELGEALDALRSASLDVLRDPASAATSFERALESLRAAGLTENLPPGLEDVFAKGLELAEGMELDPAELLALGQSLAELMEGRMGELARAGLLDPSKLGKLEGFSGLEGFLPTGHVCDEVCESGGP